ncbi:MATE family efflux transporter [Streptomyces sp. NPDC040750]|uniref:MATE family efflux transporter n=1 Tax=Streptomyces sp. NPDC040750 TaxID=3154491 RepID=UPI0033EF666E
MSEVRHARLGGFARELRETGRGALPLYLSIMVGTMGLTLDTAMVGQFGPAALAAIAVGLGVYSPAFTAITGALRGMIPVLAEHREDDEASARTLNDGMWLAFALGCLGCAVLASASSLFGSLGVDQGIRSESGVYATLLGLSLLPSSLGYACTYTLVSRQENRWILWIGIAAMAVRSLTTLGFVFGTLGLPRLGVAGAGLGAVAGALTTLAGGLWALGRSGVRVRPHRPRTTTMLRLARLGLPVSGTVLTKFTVLAGFALLAGRLGEAPAAAHAVALNLTNVLFAGAIAIGQSNIPRVGVHRRAGDQTAVRMAAGAGLALTVAVSVLLDISVWCGSADVLGFYSSDAAVRSTASEILLVVLVAQVLDAVQAGCGFFLIACQDTVFSLGAMVAAYGLVALPLAFLLRGVWGLTGLWAALAVGNGVLVMLQGYRTVRHLRGKGTPDPQAPAEPLRVERT